MQLKIEFKEKCQKKKNRTIQHLACTSIKTRTLPLQRFREQYCKEYVNHNSHRLKAIFESLYGNIFLLSKSSIFKSYCQKIKWPEKVTNEHVPENIGEKRTVLNNIPRRKANLIGHILRRNCLLHDAIEGQVTEVKGVGRRRTQLLDDLRNMRRYWELKEEAEARKRWRDSLSIENEYLP